VGRAHTQILEKKQKHKTYDTVLACAQRGAMRLFWHSTRSYGSSAMRSVSDLVALLETFIKSSFFAGGGGLASTPSLIWKVR